MVEKMEKMENYIFAAKRCDLRVTHHFAWTVCARIATFYNSSVNTTRKHYTKQQAMQDPGPSSCWISNQPLTMSGMTTLSTKWLTWDYHPTLSTTFSDITSILAGVPEGSILAPILFTIYVSDPPSFPQFCNLFLFVDDTAIAVKGRTITTPKQTLEMDKYYIPIRSVVNNKIELK